MQKRRRMAPFLFIGSILPGQHGLGFLPGDLSGVAPRHDLHVLVVELVTQIEERGNNHADDRHQGVHDPQSLQRPCALLDVQRLQRLEALRLHGNPVEAAQQRQSQRGRDRGGDLYGEGLNGEGDALGADAGFVLTVLGTVRGEHEGENAHDAHGNGADAGQRQEQRPVFVANEENHQT